MNVTRLSRLAACLLVALLVLTGRATAQTALPQTTLSVAITGAADQFMTIASTTGWTATATTQQNYALIDRELVAVRTVNTTSKVIGITRGQIATRGVPHISGATVWFLPANLNAMINYIPSGQCQRSLLSAVPLVVTGGVGLTSEVGGLWDCLGVGASGQWVETNGNDSLLIAGSIVASATSITPTGNYFQVSGVVNPVNTIVVPAGATTGFCIALEPTGLWSTGTGGNIVIASTAVVGKVLNMCWNATSLKWQPSY